MPTVSYLRLDGKVAAPDRFALAECFNSDASIDLMLLTTSVGGLGLTLTGADVVIFLDHDWNPMKDLQAMDRAHRIGQRRVVNVYRLVTRGTLEEKIMSAQAFKRHVAATVVNQQNAALSTMNTHELLDLFELAPARPADATTPDEAMLAEYAASATGA
ncbi:tbp-associated factor 172, partial [Chrysochromulina tobinii]